VSQLAHDFDQGNLYFRKLDTSTDTGTTWEQIFHDTYHPNADVWTTARNHTVTLTGDVTGTATQSVNGSGNKTWTVSTAIADDSHNHHRLDSTDDRDMKPNTSGITSSVQAIKPFFSSYGGMTGNADTVYVDVLAFDTYSDSSGGGPSAITFKKGNSAGNPEMHIWKGAWGGTTWGTGQRVFADNYHPNADVWTTARNHTVTLTGDVTGTATQSVNGSGNKTWTVATTAPVPSAPSITATSVVGETIEVTFSQSSTSGVDHYEVWSDGGSGTDYSLVARVPEEDIASSMSIIDSSFDDGGTIAYRAYAVKNGVYSTAATATRTYTVSTSLDVTSLSVVPDINVYHINYNKPASRFIDHIEIYKDAEAVQGNLSRTGAALVYSGANSAFTYSIGASDLDKYHQFWVEVVAV
jgi:hypothetical protein